MGEESRNLFLRKLAQLLFFTSLAARHQRGRGRSRSHPTCPHWGPEGRARAGRGFLAADCAFLKRHPVPSPHHKAHNWEILASAASSMLLNTAENCTPQTLLTTEADRQGRMDQAGPAGGRFHTHNNHKLAITWGRGQRSRVTTISTRGASWRQRGWETVRSQLVLGE